MFSGISFELLRETRGVPRRTTNRDAAAAEIAPEHPPVTAFNDGPFARGDDDRERLPDVLVRVIARLKGSRHSAARVVPAPV